MGTNNNTFKSMLGDFYNRDNTSMVIMIWTWSLISIFLAVWSAIMFFKVDAIKDLIMYAAVFVCSVMFLIAMKIFAWQIIHRNHIKRHIKNLEEKMGANKD